MAKRGYAIGNMEILPSLAHMTLLLLAQVFLLVRCLKFLGSENLPSDDSSFF